MALRFYDGFEHYPAVDGLAKWTSGSTDMVRVQGRFDGASSAISYQSRTLTKVLDTQPEWIIGFAWKNIGWTGRHMAFSNGATYQGDLYFDAGTGLWAYRRAGVTTLATATKSIPYNAWYYIEFRIVFSDTVGVVHMKIDGVDQFNLTLQDTNNAGSELADRFTIGWDGVGGYLDDFYMCDGTGPAPYNTFLGDVRCETIYPSGNGNSNVLVGSDADSTDNYLLVDDPADPDDDTTYVESSTVGHKDTYAYGNVTPTTGTVYAVQILPWARKTDAGTRSIVTVARLSGTEVDSAAITLPSSYTYVAQDIRTTKPGGGAWSITDVNNAEFGVKVNA